MKEFKTIKLNPDEYKTISSMEAEVVTGTWIIDNGLFIIKDEIYIQTPTPVDADCIIEIKYREEKNGNFGRVKYLSSSPRRKYFMFLKWYIIIFFILSLLFLLYEVKILGNYAIEGSRSYLLLLPSISSWFCLNILILRNTKSITKIILMIFSYFLLLICTINFITYLKLLFLGISVVG